MSAPLARRAGTLRLSALVLAIAGPPVLAQSATGSDASLSLVHGAGADSGTAGALQLSFARSRTATQAFFGSVMVAPNRSLAAIAQLSGGNGPAPTSGWEAAMGGVRLSAIGSRPIASLGGWLQRVGVRLSVSVEKSAFVYAVRTNPSVGGRPFVIAPVTHDTLAIPHDTLSPQEAATRQGGATTFGLRGGTSAVVAVSGAYRQLSWRTSVGRELGSCCAAAGTPPRLWGAVSLEEQVGQLASFILSTGTRAPAMQIASPRPGGFLSIGADRVEYQPASESVSAARMAMRRKRMSVQEWRGWMGRPSRAPKGVDHRAARCTTIVSTWDLPRAGMTVPFCT